MSLKDNNKYEPKDLPRNEKLTEEISAAELLFKINNLLSKIGLGSTNLQNAKAQFENLKKQQNEIKSYPTKYNRYFSEKGWIAHDSMDFKIIKGAVDLFEKNKPVQAEELIKKYYSPDNIESRLIYLHHIPEFKLRIKILENALEDYKKQRYYSVVPLLLTIIDGVINDVMQKGFHAENLDMAVWDSITSTDTGIQVIKKIFTRSRTKTNTDEIDLPYRNGILHGRDLSYDNYTVACKSWAFIFFIKDWIISKNSEDNRFEKFIEKNKIKSLSELAKDHIELEKLKTAIKSWKVRQISKEYLHQINNNEELIEAEPESIVIKFLHYWKKKNYGKMAEAFSTMITDNYKKYAGEIRSQYSNQILKNYEIIDIVDEAPAISEIIVSLYYQNLQSQSVKFRCIYEKGFADSLPRGFTGGNWKIVWVHDLEE